MLVVLNHKCHLEMDNLKKYVKELNKIKTRHQLVLCPSYIFLTNIKSRKVILGSQNVSSYQNGPYTGEVSAKQLSSLGVKYCIVGHSERRIYQKETNHDIHLKIEELLKYHITPILCIGEKEKNVKGTKEIIKNQIQEAVEGIKEKEKIIISYEPVWSIGTGDIPRLEHIKNIVNVIRTILPKNQILYGGSITEDNIKKINQENQLDGFLLGNVSLNPKKIKEIVKEL